MREVVESCLRCLSRLRYGVLRCSGLCRRRTVPRPVASRRRLGFLLDDGRLLGRSRHAQRFDGALRRSRGRYRSRRVLLAPRARRSLGDAASLGCGLGLGVLGLHQVVADLFGEDLRIAANRRGRLRRLAGQRAQQPALLFLRGLDRAAGEQRDGERLEVLGAVEMAQLIRELLLVARREQRRDEDDVGHTLGDRGDGAVLGIGEHEVRAHPVAHDLPENRRLFRVGLERQDERHAATSSP